MTGPFPGCSHNNVHAHGSKHMQSPPAALPAGSRTLRWGMQGDGVGRGGQRRVRRGRADTCQACTGEQGGGFAWLGSFKWTVIQQKRPCLTCLRPPRPRGDQSLQGVEPAAGGRTWSNQQVAGRAAGRCWGQQQAWRVPGRQRLPWVSAKCTLKNPSRAMKQYDIKHRLRKPNATPACPRTCQARLLNDRLPLLSVRLAVAAAIPRAATWLCTARSASLAQ